MPCTLNGEVLVRRVLRSCNSEVVQSRAAKLVESKIPFKVRKGASVAVKNEDGKPRAQREAGAVAKEQGKKERKSSKRAVVTVGVDQVGAVGASGLRSVETVVTVSSSRCESWSVSLCTAEAITEATKHLVASDAKLAHIIGTHGACPVWEHKCDCFSALACGIVYQQLSGNAALSTYARLVALCGVNYPRLLASSPPCLSSPLLSSLA